MTRSLNVRLRLKTTEQHLIVRTDKSVASVTNTKRVRSTFCNIEANYGQTRSIARPLCDFATTELLVLRQPSSFEMDMRTLDFKV